MPWEQVSLETAGPTSWTTNMQDRSCNARQGISPQQRQRPRLALLFAWLGMYIYQMTFEHEDEERVWLSWLSITPPGKFQPRKINPISLPTLPLEPSQFTKRPRPPGGKKDGVKLPGSSCESKAEDPAVQLNFFRTIDCCHTS